MRTDKLELLVSANRFKITKEKGGRFIVEPVDDNPFSVNNVGAIIECGRITYFTKVDESCPSSRVTIDLEEIDDLRDFCKTILAEEE